MNWFVTADPHFDHDAILRHCNRPWVRPGDLNDRGEWVDYRIGQLRLEEMNEALVENWNKKVPNNNSTVIVCGDFAWRDPDKWLARLNGKKILVIGNHDKPGLLKCKRSFSEVHQMLTREINGQYCVFMHFPMRSWNASCHGSWHIHGHCHCRLKEIPGMLCFDAGVDGHKFEPWEWETEIVPDMQKRITVRNDLMKQGRLYERSSQNQLIM